jgi:hypothetical protein
MIGKYRISRWMRRGIAGGVLATGLLVPNSFVHGRLLQTARVNAAPVPPIFVELFTSEGCSSCPPADDLLAQIAEKIPNAVVLSEHVTYWNNGGWHDPFSSDESTNRQADYVRHMGLSSSYTPEMVVDGTREFTGSDGRAASKAISEASDAAGVPVTVSNLSVDASRQVSLLVNVGKAKSSLQLIVVAAQDEGTKHVSNGENGGHTLRHVMIARSFTRAAKVKAGEGYSGRITLDLPEAISGSGWHVIAFVQQGSGGPVVGVASAALAAGSGQAGTRGQ